MVELGLIDADAFTDRQAPDLREVVGQFRARIAELAETEPSVLGDLRVRPLEVMRSDEPESASTGHLTHSPLTVVFSDLEGFTSFTERSGDLEAGALLRDHYDTVDAIVRGRGGTVVKKIGDGHMLSFPEPAAAIMAALDLVEEAPKPLHLRAGAHTGPVVRTGDDLFGHVVNVASRVTDLAAGGVSLVTAEVRAGAGSLPRVEFSDPHVARLTGIVDPVEVCEAVAV